MYNFTIEVQSEKLTPWGMFVPCPLFLLDRITKLSGVCMLNDMYVVRKGLVLVLGAQGGGGRIPIDKRQ